MKQNQKDTMPIHSFEKLQNIGLTIEDFAPEQKKLNSKIILEDIKIYAYHGVLPEERTVGTNYIVNAIITANLEKASQTDQLSDTLNYAEMNKIIHQEMQIPSALLERVIARIIVKLEEKFPQISHIKIKLTKTNPPMKGEMKGVSVEMEKFI